MKKIDEMRKGQCKKCPHLLGCMADTAELNVDVGRQLCRLPEGDQEKYRMYQVVAEGREYLALGGMLLKKRGLQ